jgi:hypothetical protein
MMYTEDVEYAAEKVVGPLVGYTIVGVALDEENESYGLVIERKNPKDPYDKKIVWVDCDPEGNGPGWLQVEDV